MECQRQLKRVGLAGSYIRILRSLEEGDKFEVSVDPKITQLKIRAIVSACPRGVFEETKEDSGA
jgi:ferredoxin-like protein FixX